MTTAPIPSPADIPRVAPKARLQWDEVRRRHVLLYPEGLVALNPTGAEILELCDGQRSVADISRTLGERYAAGGIERDVQDFLAGLTAKGLVRW
ncbi:MAG TPA: pyrroloquinoline quinone biosynthesis peptide chaperone PqqD [Gemmatimonadales bacterium]|nr:pyrroloquinoline quinone biosynthesis peptide chaperone PqqD [Gemmatimonadales bacterium]